ncbi:MAG: hypothetical protein H7246_19110 [Phycisphaerae bacterium]|nr:hypothetical protein [Saprospiraceae bacterium]
MEVYDDQLPIKAALAQLFERFGFNEDAYTAKWFALYIRKFPIYLPNIPSRVKVARFHDIHHVLTGYPANWRGEAEIGAWELATGCRTSLVAWFLNGGAVFVGLILFPKAVWRAFKRGWRSKTNLYFDFEYEPLLTETVKDLRKQIGLAEV